MRLYNTLLVALDIGVELFLMEMGKILQFLTSMILVRVGWTTRANTT